MATQDSQNPKPNKDNQKRSYGELYGKASTPPPPPKKSKSEPKQEPKPDNNNQPEN